MKMFCIIFLSAVLTAQAQRLLVSIPAPDSNGWPTAENWHTVTTTNTATPAGWSTNMTIPDYTAAVPVWRSNLLARAEAARTVNLLALRDLFADFALYEDGWKNGTNYNNATLQVILRKHNGAFLRLRPLLTELYKGD
jgi:hypothetical protein